MTPTEARMAVTDIDALIAEGKKAALSAAHDDCLLLSDLADALECTQAVVKVMRSMHRRAMLPTELQQVLAALDAPPPEKGEG